MNDARTNPITMSRSAAEVYAHNYATAYAAGYAQAMAAQQAAAVHEHGTCPKKAAKSKSPKRAPQPMAAQQAAAAEQPKRPLGSYFIFQAERRDKVKAANPGISVKEIASKIGEEWRALSDAQKQK